MPASRPLLERFWEKVNKDGPVQPHRPELGQCWVWTASLATSGYGAFGVVQGDIRMAHRVSWRIAHGTLPDEQWVLHKCDNRRCVRPDHLFLGNAKDNSADMWAKGRGVGSKLRGERHCNAKLSFAQITEIRERYQRGERNQSALGREYGVTSQQIGHIVRGEQWLNAC